MDGVALNDHLTSAVQTVQPRGLSGDLFGSDARKEVTVLKPGDAIAAPTDGVTLTGIGYADGRLHVQAYYTDILKTDNHGSISLVNRETGERIDGDGSTAFLTAREQAATRTISSPALRPTPLALTRCTGNSSHPMALWREIGA